MKRQITFLIALTLGMTACNASAQRGRCAISLPPLIQSVFDADNNGNLSDAEISGATAALLKLDKNQDGKIDAAELCPAGGRGWGRGTGACPVSTACFDTDKDGTISAAEAEGAPAALTAFLANRGAGAGRGGFGWGRGPRGGGRGGCPWALR